jgi:beta-lactam-binding protein with PASTA domain
MPGQLVDGVAGTRESNLVNAKAYCEGRQAKAWTEATNPHVSGSEAFTAWAAGYALAIAAGKQGPCNITAGVAVPDLAGRTLVQATGDLTAVDLVVGSVINTAGVVTDQSIAADVVVRPGRQIVITLLGVAVPNLVGMTAAVAEAALIAVGLILGTTTKTTGPVASQGTAAGTAVALGDAVNITLTS